MITFERVKKLADKRKISIVELEEKLGFSRNSLYAWKRSKPSIDKLNIVADYFNVTTDYLLGRTNTPQFSAKNERDVQKTLEEISEGLSNKTSLAYFKNDGEEISEEDAALLKESLEFVIRQSKILSKQKFTPKKYRKDNPNEQ